MSEIITAEISGRKMVEITDTTALHSGMYLLNKYGQANYIITEFCVHSVQLECAFSRRIYTYTWEDLKANFYLPAKEVQP